MKHRCVVLLLSLAVALGLLSGCAGRSEPSAALTAAGLGEQLKQAVNLSTMEQGNAQKLSKLYHIEEEDIADFVLYTSLSNVKADELAIIKVKAKADIEGIKDKIQQRIVAQRLKFQDYRPEEYYWVEKYVLKQGGPFVLFAISPKVDQIERAFDEAMKERY